MTRQEVLRAIADHGDDAVEYYWCGGAFTDVNQHWGNVRWEFLKPLHDWEPHRWRLKPQERYVELTMDDVPQGAEFRVCEGIRHMPQEINESGIFFLFGSATEFRSWNQLKNWEMRAPGGTWQPCRKAVRE
jgi:hypothetical protein